MSLKEKLAKCVPVGALLLAGIVGCATASPAKVSDVSSTRTQHFPGGYEASLDVSTDLRTLAGILTGDINVTKTEDGYVAEGSFSQILYPKLMEKLCKLMDGKGNQNHVIEREEIFPLLMAAYEKYAK